MGWIELARGQNGVITRSQLHASGLTEHKVKWLVARAELKTLHPGVFLHRSVPPSWQQSLWAAALWSDGVISHRSAARLWRIEIGEAARIHVTTGDVRFIGRQRGVALHRVGFTAHDVVVLDGLQVTSRSRTVIDLLRTEPRGSITALLDRSIQRGLLTADDIRRALKTQPGRTGNVRLRELLASIEPDADAESERVLHRLLRSAGLTGWKSQLRVRLAHRTVYLDVGFARRRVGVEVDGRRHHDDKSDQFEDDRVRQNALVGAGWTILRFTWRRLNDEPHAVIDEIRNALKSADRARSSGPGPPNLA